jgi:bifunctional DNA-binding transcriptional regulator/antitoxin component of YhaV-PrlF toxin-antitoxin module
MRRSNMFKLQLIEVENGTAIVLPAEVLERLKVGKGDWIELTECADGFIVRKYNPDSKP